MIEALREINNDYISIVYTASHKIYADAVINYFDPIKELISYRLYRHNCIRTKMLEEFIYVKDLRIFRNVDLKDIIIIDNSVLSFVFQFNNGIPILPFYDNKKDMEFKFLVKYLHHLSKFDNIGEENKTNIPLEFYKKKANNEEVTIETDIEVEDDKEDEKQIIEEEIKVKNEDVKRNEIKELNYYNQNVSNEKEEEKGEVNYGSLLNSKSTTKKEEKHNVDEKKKELKESSDEDDFSIQDDLVEISENEKVVIPLNHPSQDAGIFSFSDKQKFGYSKSPTMPDNPSQDAGIFSFRDKQKFEYSKESPTISKFLEKQNQNQLNTYICHIPTTIKVVDNNGGYKNNDTVSYEELSSLEKSSMYSDDDSLNLSHASYKKNLIIRTNIKKRFHYDNYTNQKDEGILYMKKGLFDSLDL